MSLSQCSSKSFLHNVGSNNCRPSETNFSASLTAECEYEYDQRREVAGWTGGRPPWAVAAPTTLPSWGSAGPPAASRQPLAAVVAQEILEGGRGCCCARLCGPGNLRGGAWCLVCRSDGLHVCTSTSSSLVSIELELLSEWWELTFLVHSLLLAAINAETSVANSNVKIEKL